MVGVEVSHIGICMKGNEDDVIKCSWNKLLVGVGEPLRIGS